VVRSPCLEPAVWPSDAAGERHAASGGGPPPSGTGSSPSAEGATASPSTTARVSSWWTTSSWSSIAAGHPRLLRFPRTPTTRSSPCPLSIVPRRFRRMMPPELFEQPCRTRGPGSIPDVAFELRLTYRDQRQTFLRPHSQAPRTFDFKPWRRMAGIPWVSTTWSSSASTPWAETQVPPPPRSRPLGPFPAENPWQRAAHRGERGSRMIRRLFVLLALSGLALAWSPTRRRRWRRPRLGMGGVLVPLRPGVDEPAYRGFQVCAESREIPCLWE